jgi:hypothetical protein
MRWGRFLIEKVLGRGGQATVLQAFDQVGTAGHVALKVPKRAIPADWLQVWIESEVGTLAKLDHPNIVRVLDAGAVASFPYVATELVDGLPMNEYVRTTPPSERQIADWMDQLCQALDSAHRRGVIHRDLKPPNVIVTPEGKPLLIDFGLASLVTAYQTEGRRDASGSYPYMAPEQSRRDPEADHRVDVFGLGGVLKFLLTGSGPYEGLDSAPKAARAGHVIGIAEVSGSRLRRKLIRIANRALSPEPDHRFQNMPEMAAALQGTGRRRLLSAFGSLGAVLVVGILVAVGLHDDSQENLGNAPASAVATAADDGNEPASEPASAADKARLRIHSQRLNRVGAPYVDVAKMRMPPMVNDRFRMHAVLPRPMNAYILTLSPATGGKVAYPPPGQEDKTVNSIDFPAAGKGAVFNEPGLHVAVLLANDEPVSDIAAIAQRMSRIPLRAFRDMKAVIVIDNEGLKAVRGGAKFDLQLSSDSERGRSGLEWLRDLHTGLRQRCSIVQIVCTPVLGPQAGTSGGRQPDRRRRLQELQDQRVPGAEQPDPPSRRQPTASE